MFEKIKNWFRTSAEEYMKQPRRVPEAFKNAPVGDETWLMTAEYASKEKPYLREYLGARKLPASENGWEVMLYKTDLRKADTEPSAFGYTKTHLVRELVELMSSYDQENMKDDTRSRVPSARLTYRKVANKIGIHFDVDGNIIELAEDAPVLASTYLSTDALKNVFDSNAHKKSVSSWQDLYTYIVNSLPDATVQPQDLASDPAWTKFSESAKAMAAKLDQLPASLQSNKYSMRDKERGLSNIVEFVIVNPLEFEGSKRATLAQHLCDATILVGLLRAGTEIYASQFAAGGTGITPEKLDLVSKVGNTVAEFAQVRFGLDEVNAKKISNLIAQGRDPYGPELPLLKTIAQASASAAPKSEPNTPAL